MKSFTLIFFLFWGLLANAASDRSSTVYSRIQSALTNVIPKSDYILIVNKANSLDLGVTSSEMTSVLKKLPGLDVGLDDKGQVVPVGAAGSFYSGPVSITLILDKNISTDTVKTIESSLNDIVGGLNDQDEVKISRASLRQPPVPGQSPVSITNNSGPSSSSDWSQTIKMLALMLMFMAVAAWFLKSFLGAQDSSERKFPSTQAPPQAQNAEPTKAVDLTQLTPSIVGLYVLKSVQAEGLGSVEWFRGLPLEFQRKVLISYPAWVSGWFEDQLDSSKALSETLLEEDWKFLAETHFKKITVLEQNFRTDVDYQRGFLMWFPSQSLRWVPKSHQQKLSKLSKKTLWRMRPELGNFVRAHELEQNDEIYQTEEISPISISSTFSELNSWPSKLFVTDQAPMANIVDLWTSVINQIEEFGPIDSQLSQAREKMTDEEFSLLSSRVVSLTTPLTWPDQKLKEWLRDIDPTDYLWWVKQVPEKPKWSLEHYLRPLKLSMFNLAAQSPSHEIWSEKERKSSNARMLHSMRKIHSDTDGVYEKVA